MTDLWLLATLGLANATDLVSRQDYGETWHPKTEHPEFFSLRVDYDPRYNSVNTDPEAAAIDYPDGPPDCSMQNMGIRLSGGYVMATNYNRWWDPKLPMFFVDDDTKMYTVSLSDVLSFRPTLETCLTSICRSARYPCSYTLTSSPVRCDIVHWALSHRTRSLSAFARPATTLKA